VTDVKVPNDAMLEQYLVQNAFQLVLVFARLGAAFMILPGLGASYVSARVRLILAIAITLVAAPLVQPILPPPPEQMASLVALILFEVFYGLFLGLLAQGVMVALHFAGTSIGRDTGLMNAMVFDPVTEQQGALVIGLLSNVAVLLIFILDIHHLFFQAVISSYTLFVPGTPPLAEDHLAMFVDIMARSFYIGFQLASPFLVFAIVFQTALGLLARVAPQMNVFFVALPAQVMMGLALLWIAIPGIIMWFLNFFEDTFRAFVPV
jgi:flagellar biosynthetic protein FliR